MKMKRLFSILLTLMLVFGPLPGMSVMAQEDGQHHIYNEISAIIPGLSITKNGTTVTDASSGDTITLTISGQPVTGRIGTLFQETDNSIDSRNIMVDGLQAYEADGRTITTNPQGSQTWSFTMPDEDVYIAFKPLTKDEAISINAGEAAFRTGFATQNSYCFYTHKTSSDGDSFGYLAYKDSNGVYNYTSNDDGNGGRDFKIPYGSGVTSLAIQNSTFYHLGFAEYYNNRSGTFTIPEIGSSMEIPFSSQEVKQQTVTADNIEMSFGETCTIAATTDGDGTLSYKVEDGDDVIDVNNLTGVITTKNTGTATVKITASGTTTYAVGSTNINVTVNKANAVAATVTANSRTYDGTEKPLVTVDNSTLVGGTMQYALGTDSTTEPTSGWNEGIPAGTDAGTYHVWYKAVGDDDHANSEPACVDVTIKEADPAPTSAPTLSCLAHVQGRGDVTATSGADSVVGTTHQSRRLEGMSLTLPEGTEGSVRYMVHTKDEGWSQGWVADGAYAGTRHQSRRVEAIRIELADGLEGEYDVWYRVHAQDYGWMGWAKNGAGAGTTGQSRRIEAYEVVVLPKGSDAPGSTDRPFEGLTGDEGEAPTLSCLAHVQGKGDVTATSGASTVVGTTHQSRRLEGMSLALPEGTEGSVRYMVHTKDEGWSQGWVADGAFAGTRGQSRRAEAIRVELDGEVADHYDVWYRVHAQNIGWMGWARDGAGAGTTGQSRRIEAYEVVLLPEGSPAPGATANAFRGSL